MENPGDSAFDKVVNEILEHHAKTKTESQAFKDRISTFDAAWQKEIYALMPRANGALIRVNATLDGMRGEVGNKRLPRIVLILMNNSPDGSGHLSAPKDIIFQVRDGASVICEGLPINSVNRILPLSDTVPTDKIKSAILEFIRIQFIV